MGWNWVRIKYINEYKKTGIGLHKFTDSVDNQEYIYSQFAIYNAHKVFPCFDQPDLKARMWLIMITSLHNVNISNSLEELEADYSNNRKFCDELLQGKDILYVPELFPEGFKVSKFSIDQIMSTYLFCIISGPFEMFSREADIPGRDSKLKLRYLWRSSLKIKLENIYNEIHEVTLTGIHWYTQFFGIPFVWDKYDQIFCPEFKFGAMENAGAVTLSETNIPSEEPTEAELTTLLNVVLHELCHMWFGNLCTMKWWNDLWLNEAFATYMAYLCNEQNENLQWKTPGLWVAFNKGKQSAINIDTLSNTHPIVKETPHTDSAEDLLNSITYGKGPGFLKQLVHVIGKDLLSNSCKLYFKKYKWQNTTLEDFIGCLVDAWNENFCLQDIDIRKFWIDFLYSKGVNSVQTSITSSEDGVQIFFTQSQGNHSSKINNQKMDYLIVTKSIDNTFENNKNQYTLDSFSVMLPDNNHFLIINHPGYVADEIFIIPNANDQAYIQTIPDDRLINELPQGLLTQIPNPVDRMIIWRGLISLTSKTVMTPSFLFKIITLFFPEEENVMIINSLYSTFYSCAMWYLPTEKYQGVWSNIFK